MLDTNAVSAWAEGDSALLGVLPKDRPWLLPAIVLGELRFGLRRSRERVILERWLTEVEAVCGVIAVDGETARHYATVREELRAAGTPIPENDVWIAALCRQYSVPLASRDGHFDHIRGLNRVRW